MPQKARNLISTAFQKLIGILYGPVAFLEFNFSNSAETATRVITEAIKSWSRNMGATKLGKKHFGRLY